MEYQFRTPRTHKQTKEAIAALLTRKRMEVTEENDTTMTATVRVGPGGAKTILLGLTYIGLLYYFLNKRNEPLDIAINPTGSQTLVTLFPTGKKTTKISHFIKRTFEKEDASLSL